MYKYLVSLIFLMSMSTMANVQSGDEIKAVEYNNSKFTIGDIKTSLLPLAKFQELHGSCWIQLNQGADNSNIDITGTDLAVALSQNSIKSSAGRVLRSEGGLSVSLGQTQEDEIIAHSHYSPLRSRNAEINRQVRNYNNGSLSTSNGKIVSTSSGSYSDVRNHGTSSTGGNETRMKNLTVNTFIKINHNCN